MSECNLFESKEIKSSDKENAKTVGKNNADCVFYPEEIIHHEFVPEKQYIL
jgi:hypothetical protein